MLRKQRAFPESCSLARATTWCNTSTTNAELTFLERRVCPFPSEGTLLHQFYVALIWISNTVFCCPSHQKSSWHRHFSVVHIKKKKKSFCRSFRSWFSNSGKPLLQTRVINSFRADFPGVAAVVWQDGSERCLFFQRPVTAPPLHQDVKKCLCFEGQHVIETRLLFKVLCGKKGAS